MTATPVATPAEVHAERLRGVAKSGGISLIGAVASSFLGFLLVVLVSRGLGASGAGAFSVAVAVSMTLTVVGRLGADTALVRNLPRMRELGRDADIPVAVRTSLVPVCLISTAFAAALWILAPHLVPLVFTDGSDAASVGLLRGAALVVPFGAAGFVALAVTRGLGTIVPMTLVESIAKPVFRCLFVAAALVAGASTMGTMSAWAAPAILGAALSYWAMRRSMRVVRRTGPVPSAVERRAIGTEMWTFAAPRGVAALCEIAGMHAGIILTSALAGTDDAGIYNAVLRLALAGTLALQALRLAIAPQVSRMLTAGDTDGVERVHHASATWIVLLSFPLYLIFAAWPVQLLSLFGHEFTAGAPSLTILSLALLVNLGTGNVSTILLMSGRSGLTLGITAGSLTLGIALTVALAPHWGVLGAAVAKGIAVVFENVAVTLAVRRTTGVTTLNRPLIAAIALAGACYGLPALALLAIPGIAMTSLPVAIGTALVGTAVYCAVVWRLRELFQLAALTAVVPVRLARRFRRSAEPLGRSGAEPLGHSSTAIDTVIDTPKGSSR
ncbi:MAG: Membrane protein involved in the export of O-antigen and teichoic acid [Actinomycetia bacterium]|nr:Membrane protein involved in the export of O-antigen and teichoic acid [Actinomycetes bacterium]